VRVLREIRKHLMLYLAESGLVINDLLKGCSKLRRRIDRKKWDSEDPKK